MGPLLLQCWSPTAPQSPSAVLQRFSPSWLSESKTSVVLFPQKGPQPTLARYLLLEFMGTWGARLSKWNCFTVNLGQERVLWSRLSQVCWDNLVPNIQPFEHHFLHTFCPHIQTTPCRFFQLRPVEAETPTAFSLPSVWIGRAALGR